jgi:dihydroneopterin aldolase
MLEQLDTLLSIFSEHFTSVEWVRTKDSLIFDEIVTVTMEGDTFLVNYDGDDPEDETKYEDILELCKELFNFAAWIRLEMTADFIIEELEKEPEEVKPVAKEKTKKEKKPAPETKKVAKSRIKE